MNILWLNPQYCRNGCWHTLRQCRQAAAASSSSSSPKPGDPWQHRAASIALGVIHSGDGKMFFSPSLFFITYVFKSLRLVGSALWYCKAQPRPQAASWSLVRSWSAWKRKLRLAVFSPVPLGYCHLGQVSPALCIYKIISNHLIGVLQTLNNQWALVKHLGKLGYNLLC